MAIDAHRRHLVDLARVVEGAEFLCGPRDVEVTGITHDSRRVTPGTMFCCVRGAVRDGHDFAGEAVERGATALLVDHRLDGIDR